MEKRFYTLRNWDGAVCNSPCKRIPICMCLDTSASMAGEAIEELNSGLRSFLYDIVSDTKTGPCADTAIVTFGGDMPECAMDFSGPDHRQEIPALTAHGMTPMGEAINMALDMLDLRRREYESRNITYHNPWLVIMTDGTPNGDASETAQAVHRCYKMVKAGKLTVFPIGIGHRADMDMLGQFTTWMPLKLRGFKFCEFFSWLRRSVSITMTDPVHERAKLDVAGMRTWSSL